MKKFAFAGMGVAVGFVGALALFPAAHGAPSVLSAYRELDLFGDAFERVRANYVREVEDSELINSAINGMVSSLDPHSSYMDPKEFSDMQVQTRGEFGGLGLEVTQEEGLVKVVTPIDDTPASRAGLKTGDFISAIDGISIQGMPLNEAVSRMRGPENSKVTLTILRGGEKRPMEVTLTRAVIRVESVKFERKGDIGYIRISSFSEKTDAGVKRAVAELKKTIGPGLIRGYVIDLRNDPGGLLDQAIAVTDNFIPGGEVVSTRGRRADDTQRYNARQGDIADGKPIVVLINEGSASASEIVAGALQDHKRATIVGVTSFGKGSVQTIIPLGRTAGRCAPSDDGAVLHPVRPLDPGHGYPARHCGVEPDREGASRGGSVHVAQRSDAGGPPRHRRRAAQHQDADDPSGRGQEVRRLPALLRA